MPFGIDIRNIKFEEIAANAGLDWNIERSPAMYTDSAGNIRCAPQDILFRSDTHEALSIVSAAYKEVQPAELLGFYQDLVELGGFKMSHVGHSFNGKKIWAMAEIGKDVNFYGVDRVEGYLMLVTSCDGSMATQAFFTTVRAVCDNMFNIARKTDNLQGNGVIKIRHTGEFNADEIKAQLGLAPTMMEDFANAGKELIKRNLRHEEAIQFLVDVVGDPEKDIEEQENARLIKGIYELYDGKGKGSELITSKGTLWGAFNAVTEYVDHHRGSAGDSRMHSAAFGSGSKMKAKAWEQALEMVA